MSSSLLAIHLRPARRAPCASVPAAEVLAARGLRGDHQRKPNSDRAVTLVFADDLAAAASRLGAPITAQETRRNLLFSGTLRPAVGDVLEIGTVRLQITGECDPCGRMNEAFGPGARKALDGLAGYTARALTGGALQLGDAARLVPAPCEPSPPSL